MKKWIFIVLVPLVVGGGAWGWYTYHNGAAKDPSAAATGTVERGSIHQGIASNGKVQSNLDVDIKCKAGGTIIKLPFDISNKVKKGDLLMELDPVDAQRDADKAQAQVDISQARLEIAQQNLQVAELTLKTDRDRAQASLQAAQSHADDAKAKADRLKDLLEKKLSSQEDYDTAHTAAIQMQSDLKSCEVKIEELKTQEIALEGLRKQVKAAEAQVKSDQVALGIAKQGLEYTKVYAPMDGVVASRPQQVGNTISSAISNVGGGTTILTLSDLSKVFVVASVDESDIGKVEEGQEVNITVDAHPGKVFEGRVVQIATTGVSTSNVTTFDVKIEVQPKDASAIAGDLTTRMSQPATASAPADTQPAEQPKDHRGQGHRGGKADSKPDKALLKPQMTANVEIISARRENVLLVPADALIRKSGKYYAKVTKDDGTTDEVQVVTGITDGQKTEVISGLSEGQTVQVFKNEADSKWKSNPQMNPGRMMGGGSGRGR